MKKTRTTLSLNLSPASERETCPTLSPACGGELERGFWLLTWLVLALLLVGCNQAARAEQDSAQPDQPAAEQNPAAELDLLGAVINPPRTIDDFSLPASTGEDFTFSEQSGKITLLYFGYMTCPDVCPTTSAALSRAYKQLGEPQDQVNIVFITVDPERDTLERLEMYMGAFHEDFIALRAENPEDLQAVMDSFGAQATRREMPDSAIGYLMDHTASVFLIGSDGKLIEQFMYGTPYEDIVHDVELLLEQAVVETEAAVEPAPDFTLPTLDGEEVSLSDFEGQPVILNFWATWCTPCKTEMPELMRVYEEYADEGLVVIGINQSYEGALPYIEQFVTDLDLQFPILIDHDSTMSLPLYQAVALPMSVFINRDGEIVRVYHGAMSAEQIDAFTAEIMAESSP